MALVAEDWPVKPKDEGSMYSKGKEKEERKQYNNPTTIKMISASSLCYL